MQLKGAKDKGGRQSSVHAGQYLSVASPHVTYAQPCCRSPVELVIMNLSVCIIRHVYKFTTACVRVIRLSYGFAV